MADTANVTHIINGSLAKVDKTKSMIVGLKLQEVFQVWSANKGNRDGLHASSVIAGDMDFCYREHVLEQAYKKNEIELSTWTLRIYLNGWYLHEKWQKLFMESGIADSIEKTRYSKRWNLSFTPDAVVNICGRKYIVEIKSMNTKEFDLLTTPPSYATRQANLYMHLTGIPHAIILVENKNNQDVKTWVTKYDHELARPYVQRLYNIVRLVEVRKRDGRLPKRLCKNRNMSRARRCPLREACFAEKEERDIMQLGELLRPLTMEDEREEREKRRRALEEMVRISEEMGLYDAKIKKQVAKKNGTYVD